MRFRGFALPEPMFLDPHCDAFLTDVCSICSTLTAGTIRWMVLVPDESSCAVFVFLHTFSPFTCIKSQESCSDDLFDFKCSLKFGTFTLNPFLDLACFNLMSAYLTDGWRNYDYKKAFSSFLARSMRVELDNLDLKQLQAFTCTRICCLPSSCWSCHWFSNLAPSRFSRIGGGQGNEEYVNTFITWSCIQNSRAKLD